MRDRETEIKIRVASLQAVRTRLKRLGFVRTHPRSLEDNLLFDTPDRKLRAVRSLVRLRRYQNEWSVTYKGTPEADPQYKSRVEFESKVENPHAFEALFLALGLAPAFRYQKYREKYAAKGRPRRGGHSLEISLDETPIGDFIELEGNRRAIDRAAAALGYTKNDYSTASYGALYFQDCQRRHVPAGDMIFGRPARRKSVKKPRGLG